MHRQQTPISKYQYTKQYTNQNNTQQKNTQQKNTLQNNTLIRNQYNTTNNYQVITPYNKSLISINIGQLTSAQPNNEPRNQSHRQSPRNIHHVTSTAPAYLCLSCGSKHIHGRNCCSNIAIKISSIFTGSALDDANFDITELFKTKHTGLLNQTPLNSDSLSDAINNQQRIKLYSLKQYTIISGTDNPRSNRPRQYNYITTRLTDCVYILIPFSLPRIYIPNYGIIQLDARNSFTLPTRELVTINNDTKKIVI